MTALATFDQWEKRIPHRPLVARDPFFLDLCRDRDVLHLGACDTPFTTEKATHGQLLHQKLKPVVRTLIGMDYDREMIQFLRDKHGISDIEFCDLSVRDPALSPRADIVLCADIIEHVNSVGDLLFNCNRLCRDDGVIVISTINATAARPFGRAFFGREAVHPDHVAYYSFSTLGALCRRWGFEPVDIRYFHYVSSQFLSSLVLGSIFRISPAAADGIIIVAKKTRNL